MKKQTEDVEAKMQQMKEKQLRSVELNALRTSGRASRKSENKNDENEEEDVEDEEQNESEADAGRGEVLAALEREKVIEARKRNEEVANDGKNSYLLYSTNFIPFFASCNGCKIIETRSV